jgi:hypothetical protein
MLTSFPCLAFSFSFKTRYVQTNLPRFQISPALKSRIKKKYCKKDAQLQQNTTKEIRKRNHTNPEKYLACMR